MYLTASLAAWLICGSCRSYSSMYTSHQRFSGGVGGLALNRELGRIVSQKTSSLGIYLCFSQNGKSRWYDLLISLWSQRAWDSPGWYTGFGESWSSWNVCHTVIIKAISLEVHGKAALSKILWEIAAWVVFLPICCKLTTSLQKSS